MAQQRFLSSDNKYEHQRTRIRDGANPSKLIITAPEDHPDYVVMKKQIQQFIEKQPDKKSRDLMSGLLKCWPPEIACIYISEEERNKNKPRRKAVPNPALELDMNRYRQKIESRFQASTVNRKFKFPKIVADLSHFEKRKLPDGLDSESNRIFLTKRCASQVNESDIRAGRNAGAQSQLNVTSPTMHSVNNQFQGNV